MAIASVAFLAVYGGYLPVFTSLAALLLARSHPARAIGLWALALTAIAQIGALWQATMGLATLLIGLICLLHPKLAPEGALGAGDIPLWPTILSGAVAPAALLTWLYAMQPDLGDVVALVPSAPLPALLLLGVAFTAVNASLEELLWRGFLQPHLATIAGPAAAIVLQALSFGLQHAHGVPRGVVGVLLAGTWALMLGMLRHHARGLLAPLLAHLVADATIAVIVLSMARS